MENMTDKDILQNKVSDFCEIIGSFSELLKAENAALEAYDVKKVSELYQQKVQLVTAYRNMTAFFIKNQEHLKDIEPEARTTLKTAATDLDALLKDNEQLLKAKMQTSKMVMDTVVNLVKMNNNTNSTSYGSQGKYSPLDNNSNALSINRTL